MNKGAKPAAKKIKEDVRANFICKVRLRNEPQKPIEIVTMEAANTDEVIARLFAKGYLIVDVERESAAENSQTKSLSSGITGANMAALTPGEKPRGKIIFRSVSTRDLITFAIQLATLLRSGIAILRGLNVIKKGTRDPYFYSILDDIVNQISQGFSLNQAIGKYPKVFPSVWVNLVEVGEISGTLPDVLEEIARYQESSQRIQGKVISAFFYPAVLGTLATGAVVFLLLTIVPKFEAIFLSMRMELPAITRAVLLVSKILRHYTLFVIGGIGSIIFALGMFKKTPKGQYVMDYIALKLPIIGSLLLEVATVRFSRSLATLLKSGVPLLQSLRISARLSENAVLFRVLMKAHDAVAEGHAMSHKLEESRLFPIFMTQLLGVGEESGEIVRFLQLIGNYYEERVDTFLGRLSSILEPLLLVSVGAVIGVIIVSVFLPLIDISTNAGR